MTIQIPLDLPVTSDLTAKSFIAAAANAEARAALLDWSAWPNRVLALFGPEGVGKTHMGRMWCEIVDAVPVHPGNCPEMTDIKNRFVWVDDASELSEATLFDVLNWAMNEEIQGLLLTDRNAPIGWPIDLADVKSRLRAIRAIEIHEPDDHLMAAIFKKLFKDRGLDISAPTIKYLMLRCERSVPAAQRLCEELDRAASSRNVKLTRSFLKDYLERAE